LGARSGIAIDLERELGHKREVRYPAKGGVSSGELRAFECEQQVVRGTVNRRFLFLLLIVCAAGAPRVCTFSSSGLETATEFDRQVKLALEEAARIRKELVLPMEKRVRRARILPPRCRNSG